MSLRSTFNSIICTGDLIRKEFIEETNKLSGKLYRQVNFTVRYAPSMEITVYGRFNMLKANGEESKMYDWVKEVYDKYGAFVAAELTGREDNGKPIWKEITSATAEKVTCKSELEIVSRAYNSKKTQSIEVANNYRFKMNGQYGIVHASETEQDGAKFSLEMFVYKVTKSKKNDEDLMFINGYGVKRLFGDDNKQFAVFPLTIKVPPKGVEDTEEKLESYKDGITTILKGKLLYGKEMIKVGENFDDEPILTSHNINEFKLMEKIYDKHIYNFAEEHANALDPKEIKQLVEDYNKFIEAKKDALKLQNQDNGIDDNELPF